MLDETALALLKTINELCDGGGYKVLTDEDFACDLPEGESLAARLKQLENGGFIAVKYSARGLFCLRALPLAREYETSEREKRIERAGLERSYGKAAFLGGALGGAAASLILFLLFCLLLLVMR